MYLRNALRLGSVKLAGQILQFLIGQAWPIPDPVLRHGWDGFFISRCKGTTILRDLQEEGAFFVKK